jgi:hypothetical protein
MTPTARLSSNASLFFSVSVAKSEKRVEDAKHDAEYFLKNKHSAAPKLARDEAFAAAYVILLLHHCAPTNVARQLVQLLKHLRFKLRIPTAKLIVHIVQ